MIASAGVLTVLETSLFSQFISWRQILFSFREELLARCTLFWHCSYMKIFLSILYRRLYFFLFDQISHHWIFIFFHFLFSIWWGHHTGSSMYISALSPSCHIGTTLALIFWALVVHESVDIIGGSCSPFYSVCCFSFESNRTSFE